MDDLTAGDTTDGQCEVRRAATATANRRRLHQVDARRQVALDAGGEAGAAVVVVRYAGAVGSEQIQVRISLRRSKLDPDSARAADFEAVGVGIAASAEALVAVLCRPAAVGLQHAVGSNAERPQTRGLAIR